MFNPRGQRKNWHEPQPAYFRKANMELPECLKHETFSSIEELYQRLTPLERTQVRLWTEEMIQYLSTPVDVSKLPRPEYQKQPPKKADRERWEYFRGFLTTHLKPKKGTLE